MKKLKTISFLLIPCILTILLTGCNKQETTDWVHTTQYYHGLEITVTNVTKFKTNYYDKIYDWDCDGIEFTIKFFYNNQTHLIGTEINPERIDFWFTENVTVLKLFIWQDDYTNEIAGTIKINPQEAVYIRLRILYNALYDENIIENYILKYSDVRI